jgi:hypothetical protein
VIVIHFQFKCSIGWDDSKNKEGALSPNPQENHPPKIECFKWLSIKIGEKSTGLFFQRFASQTTYSLMGQKFPLVA